jgi:hypothetical protein
MNGPLKGSCFLCRLFCFTRVQRLFKEPSFFTPIGSLRVSIWAQFCCRFGALLEMIISAPCGGGLEYLHRSPASRKRRQKGNPVSNETVKFGLKFCLHLDLTVSTVRYRSVLSSERAPYITIQVNVRVKEI